MTDLRRSVIEAARRHGLGGVAVTVIRRGEPVSMACLGLADQASGREITPDTGLFVPIAFRPAQRGRDSSSVQAHRHWPRSIVDPPGEAHGSACGTSPAQPSRVPPSDD